MGIDCQNILISGTRLYNANLNARAQGFFTAPFAGVQRTIYGVLHMVGEIFTALIKLEPSHILHIRHGALAAFIGLNEILPIYGAFFARLVHRVADQPQEPVGTQNDVNDFLAKHIEMTGFTAIQRVLQKAPPEKKVAFLSQLIQEKQLPSPSCINPNDPIKDLELLLEAGLDPDFHSLRRSQPFWIMQFSKDANFELAAFFLHHGATPTPAVFDLASAKANIKAHSAELLRLMLEKNPTLLTFKSRKKQISENFGNTPEKLAVLKVFLEGIKKPEDFIPFALHCRNYHALLLLLEKEADRDKLAPFLHDLASDCSSKAVTCAHILLHKGVNPNGVADSKSPLVLGLQSGNSEFVQLLLEKKADPNSEGELGNRPLHFLLNLLEIGEQNLDYCKYWAEKLIEAGAAPSIQNDGGKVPYDLVPEHLKERLNNCFVRNSRR